MSHTERAGAARFAGAELDEPRTLAARIGAQLRARRKELHLTLAETAERSGLSTSYMSAVENGANLPSLATLAKITDALDTTIPTVLIEEGANRVRQGRLPESTSGQVDLAHNELQLKVVAIRLSAGEASALELPTKDHDVFCYVLEGTLEVLLDDRELLVLSPGDGLEVRSATAVSFASPSGALAVWTSCPVRV